MSDQGTDDPRERRKGPFTASKETTEDGQPVGIEVGGQARTRGDRRPPGGAGSADHPRAVHDEDGDLDDAGETRRVDARDIHDREDLPASADRDLDTA